MWRADCKFDGAMLRHAWFCCICAVACGLFAGPVEADPLTREPEARMGDDSVPPQHARGRHWYGWQGLGIDAAALTVMLSSHSTAQFAAGATAYELGTPITHLAHGRSETALGSLTLRVAGSLLALETTVHIGCRDQGQDRKADCSGAIATGAAILSITSIVDAAWLAYADDETTTTAEARAPVHERDPPCSNDARRRRHEIHPRAREATIQVIPALAATPGGVFVGASGSF